MKKVIFILALTAASFAGFAQDGSGKALRFSIGAEAALPMSDWKDAYSFAIGGSAQADYFVAPDLALTLNAGYMSLSGKDQTIMGVEIDGENVGLVPVLAGIRYFFSPQFFGSAQLGATFGTQSGSGTLFTYAPGVGYKFSDNIDAMVKYTGFSAKGGGNASLLGLRIAYTF